MLKLILATAAALFGDAVCAGFIPPVKACLPGSGLTELSGCAAMVDRTEFCKTKETVDERLECACVQELLTSYYDCKSDIYKCIQMDAGFFFDDNIREWHKACDGRLASVSTTITNPPQPTLTATYDPGACDRLAQSCFSADRETNACSNEWLPTSSVSFVSCACQPPVYSLMSECMYNGNVSCKLQPAYESNILGYRECSYFWTGSETLPPVDMTSFLSLTDRGMKQTAMALQDMTVTAQPTPRRTFESVAQTTGLEAEQDL
ncbi:hypothetical protein B0H63DRAFT_186131 [Podospora didyma]|uniref:Extracellular membrane protein CFEM domain-containing protein n=1 Tax=Podospora didyma TaxID=330526 RepID=A0AAE0TZR8_9PEZI|nr:hypothetical protein B0H63DRAFT_186131 [Podospora didyma]